MGLLKKKEPKSRKKWLGLLAVVGAAAAAVGLKKRRSASRSETEE